MLPRLCPTIVTLCIFALTVGTLTPIESDADETTIYRRPASEIALRLVHDYELKSHMEALAKSRRWAALVSVGNYALSSKHAILLDPQNRRGDKDPFDPKSVKHSIYDEHTHIQFAIATHWNLAQAHVGLGNVKQSVVHLQTLSELVVALENASIRGSDFRHPDIAFAVATEQRCRQLLNWGYADEYLECVGPHIPLLEKHANKDKSGCAPDSLSMIRLIQGRWAESDALLLRSFQMRFGRSGFLMTAPLNHDRRFVLSMVAQGQSGFAAGQLRQLAMNIGLYNRDRLDDSYSDPDSTKQFLEKSGSSILSTSLGSFASVDSAFIVPALEAVMARKRSLTSHVRGFANWIYRRGNESGRDETFRRLGQAAGSSMIARSQTQRFNANAEAEGLFNVSSDSLHSAGSHGSNYDFDADNPTLEKVQATMKPGTAILECTVTNYIDFGNLKQGVRWKSPRYVAWLIRDQGDPAYVDIGDQAEIEELVGQIQNFSSAPAAAGENDRETCAASEELAQRVFGTLKGQLDNIEQIVICADGALWLVPWAMLPVQKDKYLIEACEISFIDTAASRLDSKEKRDKKREDWKQSLKADREQIRKQLVAQRKSAKEIASRLSDFDNNQDAPLGFEDEPPVTAPVILADIDYDADKSAVQKSESKFFKPNSNVDPFTVPIYEGKSILPRVMRLPATAKEAAAMVQAIRVTSAAEPKLYTQLDALESVVRSVKNPEILIFATHGFFLPQFAAQRSAQPQVATGAVHSSDQKHSQSRNAPSFQHLPPQYQALDLIDNPYFRCGLLLTGANSSDKWGEVRSADGILTGMEVSMMDLRGTKLVVLSACETGLGDPTIGEGVASLKQAFQMAGAESVVATLWHVRDGETAELMGDFFTDLKDSTAAASLRKAQLKQIAKRRELYGTAHPYYWAAFSVTQR